MIKELTPRLSFKYGDTPTVIEGIGEKLFGVLKVTTEMKIHPEYDAIEWVSYFENTGSVPTEVISSLCDCDISIPFPRQASRQRTAIIPDEALSTKIYSSPGCCDPWSADEFKPGHHLMWVGHNNRKCFSPTGGRSSQGTAPFFNAEYEGKGVVIAPGWSGNWFAEFEREENALLIKSGICDINTRLLPGEKVRTSSIVIMGYEGDFFDSRNKWRRLIKAHYSLIGREGRGDHAPFCGNLWGGMSTEGALKRIRKYKESELPIDYIWMDAGWYGDSTAESPDEFEGDWPLYTGDWRVNETHHPNGMTDIVEEIRKSGYKFLLWFEPERVVPGRPITLEHPEYFLSACGKSDLMLNLSDEKAWSYIFETLSELIERFSLSCMRQDFNFEPLDYWRSADGSEDRRGITEIKYNMGLYKLWDSLLERFPNLIIDNCASGGRRIDIETLRRSVPLWRTDYACHGNFAPEGVQNQGMSFGLCMPYSGTSMGRIVGDVYRMRSTYAPGFVLGSMFSERAPIITDEEAAFLKKYSEEYLGLRDFLSSDIYPLSEISASSDSWNAVEYFSPESGEGIIQVFKHATSPYSNAAYKLRGLSHEKAYVISDADTNEEFTYTGKELLETGFGVEIKEKRVAKLYYIKEV